ncbi:MAG: type II toxin-antitoxin system RelE/ParE family toxin [Spirochaetia bacterium]|nr:type II toxin-antitoxin system RelE/ParE family toxin [Spirochaetia bacterium]
MKVLFADENLKRLYEEGKDNKHRYPTGIVDRYIRRIDYLRSAETFNDLYKLKSLKFEKIDNNNRYSMRINDQYRLEMTYETQKDGTILVRVFVIRYITKHYRKG